MTTCRLVRHHMIHVHLSMTCSNFPPITLLNLLDTQSSIRATTKQLHYLQELTAVIETLETWVSLGGQVHTQYQHPQSCNDVHGIQEQPMKFPNDMIALACSEVDAKAIWTIKPYTNTTNNQVVKWDGYHTACRQI